MPCKSPALEMVTGCTASCAVMHDWLWMLWTGRVHVYPSHWHSQTRVNPKASVPLLFIVTFPLVCQIQWHTPWESVCLAVSYVSSFHSRCLTLFFLGTDYAVWTRYIWDLKVLFCKWELCSDSVALVLNRDANKILSSFVIRNIHFNLSDQ